MEAEPRPADRSLTPATLVAYLFGRRQAIHDVAASRYGLLLGALFCLSAGFAREYDGEDLVAEPWHLLAPLGASLVTSFLLYSLLWIAVYNHSDEPPGYWKGYPRFLRLYWMTAPLAWLYALPVERWLGPVDSVRANLALLGIISLWRVLLITRTSAVLYGAGVVPIFFIVMLFADTLAVGILSFTRLPILDIMGGIRLTETESVVLNVAVNVQVLGVLTWLIWFIGFVSVLMMTPRDWRPAGLPTTNVSRSLWTLAAAAIALGAAVLPYTQGAIRLRNSIEEDLQAGRIDAAVAKLAAVTPSDLPPHWDPLPRPGYGENEPPLAEVLLEVLRKDSPDWLKEVYLEKLRLKFAHRYLGPADDIALFAEAYTEIAELFPESRPTIREGAQRFSKHRWSYERIQDENQRQGIERLFQALDLPPPVWKEPDTEKATDRAAESEPAGEEQPNVELRTE